MRFATFGPYCVSFFFAALIAAGCGTQSSPVADNQDDKTTVVDNTNSSNGLPLLAVPGPDDANGSSNKGKVTRAGATAKSGPSLLPKGLFGKKAAQPDAPAEAAAAPQKVLEKGSPEWLLTEIQRVRLLPLPNEVADEKASEESESEDEDDQPSASRATVRAEDSRLPGRDFAAHRRRRRTTLGV